MSVWYAIKGQGYDDDEIVGPFRSRWQADAHERRLNDAVEGGDYRWSVIVLTPPATALDREAER